MLQPTRVKKVEVNDGFVKIPDDFGMLQDIIYTYDLVVTAAKVERMLSDRIEISTWRETLPDKVELHYFDSGFCMRNRKFVSLPSSEITQEIKEEILSKDDPYDYYVNHWKPEEPKLSQQDFPKLFYYNEYD